MASNDAPRARGEKPMNDWIDGLLEGLADECVIMGHTNLLERLRAKLKPLLEAGEVLCANMPRTNKAKSSLNAVRKRIQSTTKRRIAALEAWDAAKAAALKEQSL